MGFSSLKQQRVRADRTRPYLLDNLPARDGKYPCLTLRVAGEENESYLNGVMALGTVRQARSGGGARSFAAVLADRMEDARLFADHVVVGWTDVYEDDGTPAAFTPDKAFEYLDALSIGYPADYDRLRSWAKNERNFRDAPLPSAEVVGKG